MRKVKA